MKTTLNKILAHGPCPHGWRQLLRHIGKSEADDEPLDVLVILDATGINETLWCLRAVDGYDRELHQLADWCAQYLPSIGEEYDDAAPWERVWEASEEAYRTSERKVLMAELEAELRNVLKG